jgi:hypothetical protein
MDDNKLELLRELPYTFHPVCGVCIYSNFMRGDELWSTCQKHTYEHKKHTGKPRGLSINRYGSCPSFVRKSGGNGELGAYEEFIGD